MHKIEPIHNRNGITAYAYYKARMVIHNVLDLFYFRFQDTILFISFGILIVASLLYRKFYTSSEKKLTISQVQNCIWPAFLMYISFYLRLYHARYDARYFQALRIASFYAPMFTLTLKKLILRHEILFFEIYLAIYVLFCGILANYGIFSLLSLRHYAVSIIYCTSNSICFAWAELIKRQPSQDKSDLLFKISFHYDNYSCWSSFSAIMVEFSCTNGICSY
ncbi:hypothetical protein TPS_02662 [Trichinella pseudospiralis]